jgi:hypothetical protein
MLAFGVCLRLAKAFNILIAFLRLECPCSFTRTDDSLFANFLTIFGRFLAFESGLSAMPFS